jgi:hypothetical protein
MYIKIFIVFIVSFFFLSCLSLVAQVKISKDTISTTDQSSILELESTTQGFLPTRMSNIQMNAIALPAEGLTVYNTDEKCLFFFDSSGWKSLCRYTNSNN